MDAPHQGHSFASVKTSPHGLSEQLPHLFCFANAGGSAEIYKQWQPSLASNFTVTPLELPGRGRRITESCCTSLMQAAHEAAQKIIDSGVSSYSIFGHSLGSVLALETEKILEAQGLSANTLFVSGRIPPHISLTGKQFHTSTDEELVEELKRLGGTHEELLNDTAFLDFILPIMRCDYQMLETYTPANSPKTQCPIHVCCGDADSDAPLHQLYQWRELTENSCDVKLFCGGHFYIQDSVAPLIDYVKHVSAMAA